MLSLGAGPIDKLCERDRRGSSDFFCEIIIGALNRQKLFQTIILPLNHACHRIETFVQVLSHQTMRIDTHMTQNCIGKVVLPTDASAGVYLKTSGSKIMRIASVFCIDRGRGGLRTKTSRPMSYRPWDIIEGLLDCCL